MCCKLIYIIMCMIMAFNGVIYMMRETGRLLLGIGARARFAAYSLFENKPSGDSNFAPGAGKYILKSPDGALEVTVSGGRLTYSAAVGGITVIEPSEIGLLIQGGRNISENVTLGEPKIESCEETYRDLDTETDITDRHMNYIIPVRAKKIIYSLEVRIWNDGFGFRLLFGEETGLLISDELTRFNVPGDTVCRYQTDLKKMQGKTLTQKTSELSQSEVLSCMTAFEFPGKSIYIMVTESDIENYPGMALRSLGAGRFKTELWDTDKFFIKGGKTPWRIVTVCRSLEELAHCRVIAHAAAPISDKIYENADWIRPGKSAWSYFIDEEHSRRFEKIMEFNALAQEAGYEYNLADNGWRGWAKTERGAFKKVKELVDDAEKRSVGIWLWQSAMDKVWFTPYRCRFFKKCEKLGIKGIKLDHIESETQFMTEFYRRFAREAAEHKLMVIYHNPQKPTGLRRTFPNVMSMEAIRGLQCKADADNDTILPFTRMLGGNADYTPLCFSVPRCLDEVSICHMLASAVIYNSAFFTVSEDPSILKAHGLDSFVSPLPVVWNETHVLPGSKIGEIVIFARRSGNRWYAAVFNSSQGERKINLPFSFLKDGAKYEAEIYTDNLTDQRGYNKVKISVTSADSADIAMRPSGGFAAVFREI